MERSDADTQCLCPIVLRERGVEGGVKDSKYPLDEKMKPLELNAQEKADLVAFMKALTGRVTKVTAPAPVE